jgi:hypothetical protein
VIASGVGHCALRVLLCGACGRAAGSLLAWAVVVGAKRMRPPPPAAAAAAAAAVDEE